jgi:serine/threonine-protein kinase HipA
MSSTARSRYRVTDQLFPWLLTDPDQPVLIGELNMVRSSRGVSLRYAPSWLERGFARCRCACRSA